MSSKSYTLILNIPEVTKAAMVADKWNICVANEVASIGDKNVANVCWSSINGNEVLDKNKFVFITSYEAYGSNDFVDGAMVQYITNSSQANKGQTLTLQSDGFLSPVAGNFNARQPIEVTNFWKPVTLGLSMLNGVTGTFSPIYISTAQLPSGGFTGVVTPRPVVRFCFDQKIRTGMMFLNTQTIPIIADFSSADVLEYTWVPDDEKFPLSGTWVEGALENRIQSEVDRCRGILHLIPVV